MSVIQMILLAWAVGTLVALRPIGSWHLSRYQLATSPPYCHRRKRPNEPSYYDGRQRYHDDCVRHHKDGCWSVDVDPILGERTVTDGFLIVALSLVWPVLMWPFLALRITPPTAAELEKRNAELKAENRRLERELLEGSDERGSS